MIKLIKRQQGLPFLLALGVMFILSASFLAVQLWSDGEMQRGAAAALEAPVIPPDLNVPTIVPPPQEAPVAKPKASVEVKNDSSIPDKSAQDLPAKTSEKPVKTTVDAPVIEESVLDKPVAIEAPESPELAAPEEPEVVKPARERTAKTSSAKTLKSSSPVKVAPKTEKTASAPEKPVKVAPKAEKKASPSKIEEKEKAVVKVAPVVEPKSPVVKPEIVEVVAKPMAKKTANAIKSIPTEVPPEWNWFSKPLKMKMADGKVEIVASEADKKTVAKRQEKAVVKEAKPQKNSSLQRFEKKSAPVVAKPFAKALTKMAKLREKRGYEGPQTVKVAPKATQKAAAALKRLRDMVRHIRVEKSIENKLGVSHDGSGEDLNSLSVRTAPAMIDEEAVAENVETQDGGFADHSLQEEGDYSGSGSSFSMRINDLIRSGAWLRD